MKPKTGPSGNRASKSSGGGAGGGGAAGIMDKLLVPRLINYAMNHSLSDIDEVSQDLRGSYREYQRRPMAAFKQMVARAVRVVQNKGGAVKPEIQLQVMGGLLNRISLQQTAPHALDSIFCVYSGCHYCD